jgi:hypothetical protein
MSERREYPFDTDSLEKGGRIPARDIEDAYGVRQGTAEYSFAMLRAKDYIARSVLDKRGEVWTIVERDGELRILTDSEAAKENERTILLKMRSVARAHHRALNVDRAQLTEEERDVHDRNLQRRGRQIASWREAGRTPKPVATERSTPLLPGTKRKAAK